MKLQVIGCSHHTSSLEMRERLAFSPEQARLALKRLRTLFPDCEAVVLSTCNRVELYFASETAERCPTQNQVVEFLAEFHGLTTQSVFDDLFERNGEDAVRHLFTVAASLDSMVVGEAQILSQVKQAYDQATAGEATGPLTHAAFQAAIRVAKRVVNDTKISQRKVSIPSVAVADFAKQIFERFDDKQVVVIGAGEMGEETVRYLMEEGARNIVIVNRNLERAQLATRLMGAVAGWSELHRLLVSADLVISTTGATEPIVRLEEFRTIDSERGQRPLFVLDLAVPRDFDPAIGNLLGVYLYSIDDLQKTCEANRQARQREWPKAERIIAEETARFMAELNHRSTGPTIRRLQERANEMAEEEVKRLFKKLGPDLDRRSRREIQHSVKRLINKLLHPPLESLRDEAERGTHHGLLDALKRLFQIHDRE